MKNYAAALLIATTFTGLLSFAGAMDLPIDGGTASTRHAKSAVETSVDGYQAVTAEEGKAIQDAVYQALANTVFKCQGQEMDPATGKESGNGNTYYWNRSSVDSSFIDGATSVERRLNKQPGLRFLFQSGSETSRQTLITTDASGRQVQEIDVYEYTHIGDQKNNVGSMMAPQFVDIPAHDAVSTTYICTLR